MWLLWIGYMYSRLLFLVVFSFRTRGFLQCFLLRERERARLPDTDALDEGKVWMGFAV